MQLIFTQSEPQKISDLPANTVFEFDGSTYIKIDDPRGLTDMSGDTGNTSGYPAIKAGINGFELVSFALPRTSVKVLGSVKVKL